MYILCSYTHRVNVLIIDARITIDALPLAVTSICICHSRLIVGATIHIYLSPQVVCNT